MLPVAMFAAISSRCARPLGEAVGENFQITVLFSLLGLLLSAAMCGLVDSETLSEALLNAG
jgi:hypothetical protein